MFQINFILVMIISVMILLHVLICIVSSSASVKTAITIKMAHVMKVSFRCEPCWNIMQKLRCLLCTKPVLFHNQQCLGSRTPTEIYYEHWPWSSLKQQPVWPTNGETISAVLHLTPWEEWKTPNNNQTCTLRFCKIFMEFIL